MKIRTDFVTNSSSSSYVIAYKATDEGGQFARFIKALVDCQNCDDTSIGSIIKNKKEFDDYFISYFGWNAASTVESIIKDEPGLKVRYEEAVKYINNGYMILKKRIDNSDDGLINLIDIMGKDNKDFVILDDGC